MEMNAMCIQKMCLDMSCLMYMSAMVVIDMSTHFLPIPDCYLLMSISNFVEIEVALFLLRTQFCNLTVLQKAYAFNKTLHTSTIFIRGKILDYLNEFVFPIKSKI